MDLHTKEQRSYNMSRIKSKNTAPEKVLFKLLRNSGFKFRRHPHLPGKPDAILIQHKVAIFVDGEFWHGRNFNKWKERLSPFWYEKISQNIKRDRKNRRLLKELDWQVVRLWGRSLIKEPQNSLNKIIELIQKSQRKN